MKDDLKIQGTNKEARATRTTKTATTYRKLNDVITDVITDVVTRNVPLHGTALKLYMILLNMSDIQTGATPPIYIYQLAEKLGRTERTVQKWLAKLIEAGLIERVSRKHEIHPGWNDSSYFVITHIRDKNCCAENEGEVR